MTLQEQLRQDMYYWESRELEKVNVRLHPVYYKSEIEADREFHLSKRSVD